MEVGCVNHQVDEKKDHVKIQDSNGKLKQASLKISGMSCAACVSRVETQLRSVSGVRDAAINLTGCTLENADLRGADLSRANLSHTKLRGADLRGTLMEGTDLRGLNIQGAKIDMPFAVAFALAHGGILVDE